LYVSTNNIMVIISRGVQIGGACSTHVEMRNAYKILVSEPEGKRPLGRPRRR